MTNHISKIASYESRSCLTEDNYKGDHGSTRWAKVVLQSQAPQAQILPLWPQARGPSAPQCPSSSTRLEPEQSCLKGGVAPLCYTAIATWALALPSD